MKLNKGRWNLELLARDVEEETSGYENDVLMDIENDRRKYVF